MAVLLDPDGYVMRMMMATNHRRHPKSEVEGCEG
jgi:hypothetical protein